jgi:F-type H+-transporting ATPase subunit delta
MSVVHRVYARALYDAAKERDRVAAVQRDLDDFVAMLSAVPELRAVLRNPQLDPRAKSAAVDAIVEGGEELVSNFLHLLVEKGRAGEVEEIAHEFERLVAAEQGQLSVELTTAFELSDEEALEIVGQIEQTSGRKVEATRAVDPSLIGGVVLQAGSFRLDASVRGRLNTLRRQLGART